MPFFKGALNSIFDGVLSEDALKESLRESTEPLRATVEGKYKLYIEMQKDKNIGNFDEMEGLVVDIHTATDQFNKSAKMNETDMVKKARTNLKGLLQNLVNECYRASTNPDELMRKSFWILVATARMQNSHFEAGAMKSYVLYRKAINLYPSRKRLFTDDANDDGEPPPPKEKKEN